MPMDACPIDAASIERVGNIRLRAVHTPWPLAVANAAAIAAHFEARRSANPAFYDGEVFVLRDLRREPGGMAGAMSLERFSSFLYWRDGLASDHPTLDGFGTALVRSLEGHVIAGRAANGTLNAGRVYLPGGFIDARDAGLDGSIDIDGGIARELAEETGLDISGMARVPGYIVARQGRHCCFCIEFRSELPAAELSDGMRRSLDLHADGELTELVVIAAEHDLDRYDVPGHARLVISHALSTRS